MEDNNRQKNNDSNSQKNNLMGWITPLIAKTLIIITSINQVFIGKRLAALEKAENGELTSERAKRVDTYVFTFFLIELFLFTLLTLTCVRENWVSIFIFIILLFRILDILATALRVSIFDRKFSSLKFHAVACIERVIVLGFLNYVELIICFAGLYLFKSNDLCNAKDWLDYIYFSAINQMTIGYGDICPTRWLRLVAISQGLAGLLLLIVLIGRFIGILKRQTDLSDEVTKR